ncbi:MAG: type IV pilus biogenesis/stability protein PilW [Gammaproteobacteria bacterium]|nr:type IV pilus biogenesis/stability protein PilW [Gammaproteobacteria bacterium]
MMGGPRIVSLVLGLVFGMTGCVSNAPQLKAWEPDKQAEINAELAASYMKRNQLADAREKLEKALEIQSDHPRANHYMGVLQARLGDNQAAERHFERAIRSDREYAQAAHDYGVFLCRQGNVDQALKQFETVLANPLYQRKEVTNLRAGECLLAKNDLAGAERYFRTALEVNARLMPALLSMAEINFASAKYLGARAYIERYFAVGPETAHSLLLAAKIERELGALEEAREYAAQLQQQFANSDEARELEERK